MLVYAIPYSIPYASSSYLYSIYFHLNETARHKMADKQWTVIRFNDDGKSWTFQRIRFDDNAMVNDHFSQKVIEYSDIRAVILGKMTTRLKAAPSTQCGTSQGRFFSIISVKNETLDFQANSTEEREQIVCALLDKAAAPDSKEMISFKKRIQTIDKEESFGITLKDVAEVETGYSEPVPVRQVGDDSGDLIKRLEDALSKVKKYEVKARDAEEKASKVTARLKAIALLCNENWKEDEDNSAEASCP